MDLGLEISGVPLCIGWLSSTGFSLTRSVMFKVSVIFVF